MKSIETMRNKLKNPDLFMNGGRQDQLAKLNVAISPSEKLDGIVVPRGVLNEQKKQI
jgi:hypothetical protein